MKDLLKRQQFHWLFTFVWLVLGLEFLQNRSLIVGGILVLLFVRILSLNSTTLFWTLCLSLIVFGHYQLQTTHLSDLQHLPLEVEREQSFQLRILPTDLTVTDDYLSSKAQLWKKEQAIEPIAVQVNYWFREDEALLPELELAQELATTWLVKGELSVPEEARNFGVFNYRDYLLTQDIAWALTITEIEQIQLSTVSQFSIWQANLRASCTKVLRQYQEYSWVGIHNKLLFNLNSSAFKDYRQDFLAMGIIHYFAISGFHLNYIRRHLRYLLLRTGLLVEMVDVLLLVMLLFYAWLVQWPIGVIRSLATFYGRRLCQYFAWPYSPMDQLALVGCLILLVNPLLFQSAAFRLSFLMSAIIQFYQANTSYQRYQFKFSAELTLACLLFSWPLLMGMNAEWNVFQLIIVILFGLVFDRVLMPSMCLTTVLLYLLNAWSGLPKVFQLLSDGFDYLWQFSAPVEWLAWSRVIVGIPNVFVVLSLLAAAVVWLYCLRERKRLAYSVVAVVYALVLGLLPYARAETRITILDVGQGDALLYQPAFSQDAWLIDTGGRMLFSEAGVRLDPESAQKDLLPALKALGIRRLTGVIITHPDADHMGNLLGLSQWIEIEHLVMSPYTVESNLWQTISSSLPKNLQVTVLELGQSVQIGGADLSVIALAEGLTYFDEGEANDSSLLVLLRLGELKLLNLGDLSIAGEQILLNEYPNLRADMIKVGHHGSNTSTSDALLSQLGARLALISAGKNNRYGHPHPEVVARLNDFGITTLKTNERGAIRLSYHPWWGYRVETALELP